MHTIMQTPVTRDPTVYAAPTAGGESDCYMYLLYSDICMLAFLVSYIDMLALIRARLLTHDGMLLPKRIGRRKAHGLLTYTCLWLT